MMVVGCGVVVCEWLLVVCGGGRVCGVWLGVEV